MTIVEYLKSKHYSDPQPDLYPDEDAGVLGLSWDTEDGAWAIIEVGSNPDSDFSLCAKGPDGNIKMRGSATPENLDVVVDFITALMAA